MKRGAKISIWVVIFAAIAVLFVVTGARRLQKEDVKSIDSMQKAEGIPVDVVRAEVRPLEDWRQFVGVAEGHEQVNLVAPFRTRVSNVHVVPGQEIDAGKVLISLDPYDPAWIAMNLNTAQTQYETARQDSLRIEELFKTGAVSRQDLDHSRAATDAARAHYLTARRAVELDTPIRGVVTALNVKAGDYAASEQTLATIASYDRIRIPLEISETERQRIEVGQPARLRLRDRSAGTGGGPRVGVADSSGQAGPAGEADLVLQGRVVKAAISADPSTRLFAVEVVVENLGHLLKPGTLVTPEILLARSDDRPVVPPIALVQSDGREHVFVVDQSGGGAVARLRNVVRGIENGRVVAVAEGISAGDVVVVWGQNNLDDGAKIKIHADLTAETYGRDR